MFMPARAPQISLKYDASLLVQNLSTHAATLGIDPESISTYKTQGVPLGDDIIRRNEAGLWTCTVLFHELQKKSVERSKALETALGYNAVLINMSKHRYNVTCQGDAFLVGTRKFVDESEASRHMRHLHIVMALDALTGGLYFGKMRESGMVVHTPGTVGTFAHRAAHLIKQEIGNSSDSSTLDRLDSDYWYRDLGMTAFGADQDPLYRVLRKQHNESPFFWGIVPRLHAMDRSKTETINPSIVEMLGMEP